MKRREVKGKGEKEFQRITRRDKKAFLSDQCKEIEENNRMGKNRDILEKIKDAKGCENWTIKKAEHRRTDAFELWCWRRTLRVPWTARRSNQSVLKEINPECSLEELMGKLKCQ